MAKALSMKQLYLQLAKIASILDFVCGYGHAQSTKSAASPGRTKRAYYRDKKRL
jgi:hypothetical protein